MGVPPKKAAKLVEVYGLKWPADADPLEVEFEMIRKGGRFDVNGTQHGEGLFHHYKRAQQLIWPDDDHHRWSDLILRTILDNRITVIMGCKDSGKTHTALSRFGLTDYFVFPNETLILMSSTDIRGLELRVWGDIKDMLGRAKDRYPWLAGNAVDAKHGVFTDSLGDKGDVRDMRKGIICIPCMGGNGEWVGVEKYIGIKQKRRRLLGDEVQFMREAYMTSLSNLDKGEFKGVFVGNPLGNGDPLDRMAEPLDGWDGLGEVTKTSTWKNKFGGITIDLVGTDSPNFDVPADAKVPYPYLLDRQDEERVRTRYGADSLEYWSQIKGVRRAGLNAHRVLTKEMCNRFDAWRECTWEGGEVTKVFGMDAAFGGDRPAGGHIEFGKEVGGQMVIKCYAPRIAPISISSPETPEEQLAKWCANYCTEHGIPSSNVYYEAGMWATFASAMSRFVGTDTNAVNFGGAATPRPVSNDEYVFDEKLHAKRLKRCDEHYSKFVTELWFSVRLVVESRQMREFPVEVAEEFYMREWTKVARDKYELETKEETKERMGKSPDLADWCAICVEGARRLGFVIERQKDMNMAKQDDDWLEKEMAKYKKFMRKHELNYRA